MPLVPFAQLPSSARLWIFAADRPLTGPDRERLLTQVDAFLAGWSAHGVPLTCARDLRHDQFLFVAVDEAATGASGCSIDAMVRGLRTLEREIGATLIDSPPIWYRDQGKLRGASREHFAELARAGSVSLDTPVFDNTLATVGEVRDGRWEVPARESWHRLAFFE